MPQTVDSPTQDSGETDGESVTEQTEQLSKSHIFELLSAERRQEVLRYLDANDGTADLGEVAEHIASLECDCDVAQLNSQQRKRVYVGLYQCHLPKMADAEVIDYDPDRGNLALNERSVRLLKYLYFEERSKPGQSASLLDRFLG